MTQTGRKYFFFDIDGTLTDPKTKQPVPSAVEAIHELQKAGHFVAVATGRAHYKAISFIEKIGVEHMVCGGGAGIVYNHRLIYNKPLDAERVCSFLAHAEEEKRGFLLMLDDSDSCYMKDFRFLEQVGLRREPTHYIYMPELDSARLPDVYKVYLPLADADTVHRSWIDLLPYLRMTKDYVVCQYDAKREGILRMLEYINGREEDVVVFGDDKNDIDMFSGNWFTVAMGNGIDALKKMASYTTDSSVDNGIWNACVKNGWFDGSLR